jgi:pimeloyl-ACP methyl ester carboxylesterase
VQSSQARNPELRRLTVNGVDLAYWEWPGEDPPVLFTHGSGFHARCWDQVIRHLPRRRCLAFDARGHGRSAKPDPPYHWPLFANDLAAEVEQLDLRGAVGVGHSMGGHSVTAAAARRPETFAALLLIDPTIWEPAIYGTKPLSTFVVRKRREKWPSPQDMFESLGWKPPFSRWSKEVLRDYCEYGLLFEEGDFYIACPPEIEASSHECAKEVEANLHASIPSITCPVTVLRAGTSARKFFNPEPSPTDPALASIFPNGRDVFLRDQSHFIPMEVPDVVAEYVCGIITSLEKQPLEKQL